MNRGRRHERVFEEDADYLSFIALLRDASKLWEAGVSAYCLMPNHYHLLIHTPLGNLSRCMRHINGVYTQRFNRVHGCDGQLFRGRFKATLVDGDSYLLQLVRYIHRNPVRSGMVDRPDLYRWSSHSGYLSTKEKWNWLYKDFPLAVLSPRTNGQRSAYQRFMGMDDSEDLLRTLDGEKWPSLLGDERSKNRLKAQFFEDKAHSQVPDSRALAPDVDVIVHAVCTHYGLDRSELVKSRRGRFNEARAMAVHLVRLLRKDSFAEIGPIFGLRTYSSVGSVLDSMRKRLASDPELSDRCRSIMKIISNVHQET